MTVKDEVAKAKARGQDLTTEEVELEEVRDRFVKDRRDKGARAEFKMAQQRVRRLRQARRLVREAEGPPADAQVKRDGTGRVIGYTTPTGDTVAQPGGMEG